MRFIIFVLIGSLFIGSCSPSKQLKKSDYSIENIKIGESFENIVRVLGTDFSKSDETSMRIKYEKLGYDPNKELVFHIGFDFVLEYNEATNSTNYPVYLIYFKDDKVSYIVLSSYIYENMVNQFRLNDINIFYDKEPVLKALGDDYIINDFDAEEYDGEYQYFEKGVSLISDEGVIRAVHLFPIMSKKEKNIYMEMNKIEIKRL